MTIRGTLVPILSVLATIALSSSSARVAAQYCNCGPLHCVAVARDEHGCCSPSACAPTPVATAILGPVPLASSEVDALQASIDAYAESGAAPGSPAAEEAARAAFLLAEPYGDAFQSFALETHPGPTTDAYIHAIVDQIHAAARRAFVVVGAYEAVLAYRRPAWSAAAYDRQARVYETFIHAVVGARHPLSEDLVRRIARASQTTQDEIASQFDDRLHMAFASETEPIECLAIVAYVRAANEQRAGLIDTEFTAHAIERLAAWGDERVHACATAEARRMHSLRVPASHELARARRGSLHDTDPALLDRLDPDSRAFVEQMVAGDTTAERAIAAVGAVPGDQVLRSLVALRLARTGHAPEAIALLDHGAPPNELAMYLARGETLRTLGRADEAVMLALAATTRFRSDPDAQLELGLAYAARAAIRTGPQRQQALQFAIAALQASIALRPDEPTQTYLDELTPQLTEPD